jgi:hypothetical protein
VNRTHFVCSTALCACGIALAQAPAPNSAAGQQSTPGSAAPGGGAVQQVDLSIPFGTVPGKLITSGEYLMFVDDQQPQGSFVIPRRDIEKVNYENGAMTMTLARPVHDRAGDRSSLSFRFADPAGGQSVANWAGANNAPRTDQSSAPSNQAASQPGNMMFDVKHKHKLGSDSGRLIVTPTQLIYESVGGVNSSRQWNMSDIKEVKRDSPYSLKITPFSGDDYRFDLVGQGMSNDQLKTLVDRVTLARVPRK